MTTEERLVVLEQLETFLKEQGIVLPSNLRLELVEYPASEEDFNPRALGGPCL